MQQPTVYDHRNVYDNGGGGGVITELPDVAVNGSLYKNLLPLRTYNNSVFIDSDLILLKSFDAYNPFLLFNGNNFTLSNTDTFEVKFTVRKPSFSGSYNTVFGSVNGYYNNITMDFGNVNDGVKSIFFGVPRSTSPSSWTDGLGIGNLVLTNNKWYTIKAIADENEINLYIEDDDGLKAATPKNKNNLLANSPLQLMGIYRQVNNAFNGQIDLKSSYIKKNGVLVWGME